MRTKAKQNGNIRLLCALWIIGNGWLGVLSLHDPICCLAFYFSHWHVNPKDIAWVCVVFFCFRSCCLIGFFFLDRQIMHDCLQPSIHWLLWEFLGTTTSNLSRIYCSPNYMLNALRFGCVEFCDLMFCQMSAELIWFVQFQTRQAIVFAALWMGWSSSILLCTVGHIQTQDSNAIATRSRLLLLILVHKNNNPSPCSSHFLSSNFLQPKRRGFCFSWWKNKKTLCKNCCFLFWWHGLSFFCWLLSCGLVKLVRSKTIKDHLQQIWGFQNNKQGKRTLLWVGEGARHVLAHLFWFLKFIIRIERKLRLQSRRYSSDSSRVWNTQHITTVKASSNSTFDRNMSLACAFILSKFCLIFRFDEMQKWELSQQITWATWIKLSKIRIIVLAKLWWSTPRWSCGNWLTAQRRLKRCSNKSEIRSKFLETPHFFFSCLRV